jgi:hypothetical protein
MPMADWVLHPDAAWRSERYVWYMSAPSKLKRPDESAEPQPFRHLRLRNERRERARLERIEQLIARARKRLSSGDR